MHSFEQGLLKAILKMYVWRVRSWNCKLLLEVSNFGCRTTPEGEQASQHELVFWF